VLIADAVCLELVEWHPPGARVTLAVPAHTAVLIADAVC